MWEEGSTLFSLDGSPMQKAPTVSVFGIKKKGEKKHCSLLLPATSMQSYRWHSWNPSSRRGWGGGERAERSVMYLVFHCDKHWCFYENLLLRRMSLRCISWGADKWRKGKKAAGMRLIYAICLENHRVSTVFPPDNPASLMCALINPPPVFDP